MAREHALLPASGASRWLACTPSALLEDKMQGEDSTYALEGRFAHELAEVELAFQLKQINGKAYKKQRLELKDNSYYDASMEYYIQQYVTIVLEKVAEARIRCKDPIILLEQKLDYGTWVPNGFGTGDVIIVSTGLLEIIDLKYGKGVQVDAKDNPQLRLYGLGTLNAFELLYEPQRIKMTVVQPRLDSVSSEELTVYELYEWGVNEVKPKAELAFKGEGDFFSGDHCQFCKIRHTCRARTEANLALTKYEFKLGDLLMDEEVATILAKASQLQAWASDILGYALDQAVSHEKSWPGWKLVRGKSNRKYKDEALVASTLSKSCYKDSQIHIKKLLAIGAMEKEIGKKTFGTLLAKLIVKPEGKPTLVLESDKRPAMSSAVEATKDFEEKNIEEMLL